MSTETEQVTRPWATIRRVEGGFVLRFGEGAIPEILTPEQLAEQVAAHAAATTYPRGEES